MMGTLVVKRLSSSVLLQDGMEKGTHESTGLTYELHNIQVRVMCFAWDDRRQYYPLLESDSSQY